VDSPADPPPDEPASPVSPLEEPPPLDPPLGELGPPGDSGFDIEPCVMQPTSMATAAAVAKPRTSLFASIFVSQPDARTSRGRHRICP
jgi:hypothetical protein